MAPRNLLNLLQMRFTHRCRTAARRAKQIWAVTPEDHNLVAGVWGVKSDRLLETGTTPVDRRSPRTKIGNEPLQVIWSGLHIHRKALPLLLHAIAGIGHREGLVLTVLGEGSETQRWKELSQHLGLSGQVTWTGQLSHRDALVVTERGHVFAHTSLKEGTATVVLEALQFGLPVVCHDTCGMGIAVTEDSGIKIPLVTPRASIEGFRMALERFLMDPTLLSQLSAGALRRADQLSWEQKAMTIARAYEDVHIREGGSQVR